MESDSFLNIEGSIGDLNHGRIGLSDRLLGSLLGGFGIGGLGLLEHLLGRGERVDRLRRRRTSEIFVRVEATNGGNVSEGGLLPPLEAIERIEVVRGPMSSLYGSDAMGGVVNIITRRISDHWRGSARVNGTMQLADNFGNYTDGNFYLSGPVTDGIGLQLQGSMNRREGDTEIGGTPERHDDSLAGKLGFNLSANQQQNRNYVI